MAGANQLQASASGTHTRVQMQRDGHSIIPHGTLQSYDPQTGVFTAFMDFQAAGELAYMFTPDGVHALMYLDQNSLEWILIR